MEFGNHPATTNCGRKRIKTNRRSTTIIPISSFGQHNRSHYCFVYVFTSNFNYKGFFFQTTIGFRHKTKLRIYKRTMRGIYRRTMNKLMMNSEREVTLFKPPVKSKITTINKAGRKLRIQFLLTIAK